MMPRVKMLTSMAGDRVVRNVGDVVEVDEGEAARLVAVGFAEAVPDAPPADPPGDPPGPGPEPPPEPAPEREPEPKPVKKRKG